MSFFYKLTTLFFLLEFHFVIASSTKVNITIDDQYGDSSTGLKPVYSSYAWIQGNGANTGVDIDASQAKDSTWHYISVGPTTAEPNSSIQSVTLNFTGTDITVYCIIPGNNLTTSMTFTLDGYPVGDYRHMGHNDTDVIYNYPAYTSSLLLNEPHTLVLEALYVEGNTSVVLFDYAEYTTLETTASSTSVALIVGVVGGIIISFVIIVLFKMWSKRRKATKEPKKREKVDDDEVDYTHRVHSPFVLGLDYTASSPSNSKPASLSHVTLVSSNHHGEFDGGPVSEWDERSVSGLAVGRGDARQESVVRESVASPQRSVTGHGSVVVPGFVPGSKAAMRQEELMNQIQDREHRLAYVPSSKGGRPTSMDMELAELRRQVEDLRTQKDQLLAHLAEAVPSPEYSE